MKRMGGVGMAAMAAVLGMAGVTSAQEGPTYDSPETRGLVERMIERQGGMAPWEAAETVGYTHVMFTHMVFKEGDTKWWISEESHDLETGRAYQAWPIDGAQAAFDGERVWSTGWQRPNRPEGMMHQHLTMVFMPWITQQPGFNFSRGEDEVLPGDEVASVAIMIESDRTPPMAFFVDPEDGALRGFAFGPARHLVRRWGDADGLRVPIDWTTTMKGEVIGDHALLHPTLHGRWDESRLTAPPDAVVAGR
jgi:hypothetical protein